MHNSGPYPFGGDGSLELDELDRLLRVVAQVRRVEVELALGARVLLRLVLLRPLRRPLLVVHLTTRHAKSSLNIVLFFTRVWNKGAVLHESDRCFLFGLFR